MPSWLLNRAAMIAQRLVADALGQADARRVHVCVLATLAEFGAHSQADLGRRCGIDRSDMVALINELAGDGLVAREPDDNDRRRNVITLTAAGQRQLGNLLSLLETSQEALLVGLSAEERAQLAILLARIVESHPEFVAGGWAQPGSERRRE
jgi:DNA-binding MarR family transcriptional regulator